jgi:hypothetical protein
VARSSWFANKSRYWFHPIHDHEKSLISIFLQRTGFTVNACGHSWKGSIKPTRRICLDLRVSSRDEPRSRPTHPRFDAAMSVLDLQRLFWLERTIPFLATFPFSRFFVQSSFLSKSYTTEDSPINLQCEVLSERHSSFRLWTCDFKSEWPQVRLSFRRRPLPIPWGSPFPSPPSSTRLPKMANNGSSEHRRCRPIICKCSCPAPFHPVYQQHFALRIQSPPPWLRYLPCFPNGHHQIRPA